MNHSTEIVKVKRLSGFDLEVIYSDGKCVTVQFGSLAELNEYRTRRIKELNARTLRLAAEMKSAKEAKASEAEIKSMVEAVKTADAIAKSTEAIAKVENQSGPAFVADEAPAIGVGGVTFDREESTKERKAPLIDEIKDLYTPKLLEGTLAEKIAQVKQLFSPQDFAALNDAEDPLQKQEKLVGIDELKALVKDVAYGDDPERLAFVLRDHFGNMAFSAEAFGGLVCYGGYAPRLQNNKIVFVKLGNDQMGLKATDAFSAAVLFVQLVGLMSSPRYYSGQESGFNTLSLIQFKEDGQLFELPARAKIYLQEGMEPVNRPFHPLGKMVGDYKAVSKMLKQQAGFYRAEFVTKADGLAQKERDLLKLITSDFLGKLKANLKQRYPKRKFNQGRVQSEALRLISRLGNRELVAQALDAYISAVSNPNVFHLCSYEGWMVVKALMLNDAENILGITDAFAAGAEAVVDTPANLAFTADPVVYPMDYSMGYEECCLLLKILAFNAKKGATGNGIDDCFRIEKRDKNSHSLFLDEYEFIIARNMEVYEADRELYVRNQLFVNPFVGHKAKEQDLALVNPYGALVYGILNNVNLACGKKTTLAYSTKESPRWGDVYSALIAGEVLPIDAEEESGGSTQGDRGLWNRYVTKPYTWNGGLAWYFDHSKPQFMAQRKFASNLDCLTTAARKKYNFAHLPKGNSPFIDGRLAWLSFGGVDKALRDRYAALMICTLTGCKDLYTAIMKVFPEAQILFDSAPKAIEWGLTNFLVALSTKDGKILKRIGHKFAKHAAPLGPNATDMALVMYGWGEPSLVHSVTAAWAPFAIAPAGQSDRVQGGNDPFLLKSSYVAEKKGTETYSIKVSGEYQSNYAKKAKDRFGKTFIGSETFNFAVEGNVVEGGTPEKPWSVQGVAVKKGETVLELQYETEQGDVATQVITAPQDCILQEVIVSSTMWNQTKVKIRYHMVQTNGKLRGNLKTTVVYTGKSLIFNEMNKVYRPDLDAAIELLICGDADKSKDLAMGIMEMVAQTLRETEKGRAVIRLLNSPLGIEDEYHLYWSYHLAALGIYDDVLREFHGEFLRPMWLQRTDVTNNYVRGVREIYLNKAGTKAKPGKGGWYQISVNELEAYLATLTTEGTHCFPFEIADNIQILTNGLSDKASIKWSKGVAEVECGEILVFYTLEGQDYMWQRTPVFAGYTIDGVTKHVKVPCKPEISTVDQAAGNLTRCMNTVYRVVSAGMKGSEGEMLFKPNPELANQLSTDTIDHIDKWAAFQAMAKGMDIHIYAPDKVTEGNKEQPVEVNPVVMFSPKQEPGKPQTFGFTDEVEALIEERLSDTQKAKAKLGQLKLTELASVFWDTSFIFAIKTGKGEKVQVNNITVYLPALVAQDANPSSTESLSGLVKHCFELCISKSIITQADGRSISVRLNAALRKMIEKSLKKVNQGRRSAQCKAQALPGIPAGEVWVLETEANTPYSFYNNLVKAFRMAGFKSEINGKQVLCTRSPIPFPAVLKVVVKQKPSAEQVALAERVLQGDIILTMTPLEAQEIIACNSLQPSQCGFSPLAAQVSGGDNDGDGYVFTPILSYLDELSFDLCDGVIKSRTGLSMADKEQGGYLADHCWVKKWSPEAISNPALITKNNIKGFKRIELFDDELKAFGVPKDSPARAIRTHHGYDVTAERAMQTFSPNVGIAHGMATRAEAASGLYKTLEAEGYTYNHVNRFALAALFSFANTPALSNNESDMKAFVENYLKAAFMFNLFTFNMNVLDTYWLDNEVALPMYEYYEGNPLGGLSFYGYCMTEHLKKAMYDGIVQQESDLCWEETVAEAGMNKGFSEAFVDIAEWCGEGYRYSSGKEVLPKMSAHPHDFIVVASELVHLIGRGQFNPGYGDKLPNAHLEMARFFLKWNGGRSNKETRILLSKENPVFNFLYYFIRKATRLFPEQASHRTAVHRYIGGAEDKANIIILKYSQLMGDNA